MDEAKKQLIDKLKTSNNILITVSRNPTVDQLASCLGLALFLNKQGKHTAAVFSGEVPSTIEFLQPEDTLEKNTDSLRDFIIALDKSKADKLRYKVEDNVVRIFITPYKTSLSQSDLEFSQGDFNVDLVVALGVGKQEDLDEAIMAHGRILHDATVASINIVSDGGLGSISWQDSQASSLSELVTDLVTSLDKNMLDGQIATALLTGVVSATERFRNDKTTSQTMSVSATLMAAGANQQLVASKLEEPDLSQDYSDDNAGAQTGDNKVNMSQEKSDDGTIEIDHIDQHSHQESGPALDLPVPDESHLDEVNNSSNEELETSTDINDSRVSSALVPEVEEKDTSSGVNNNDQVSHVSDGSRMMTEPPSWQSALTANSQIQELDPVTDPFSVPSTDPPQLLERKPPIVPSPPTMTAPPLDWSVPEATSEPISIPSEPDITPSSSFSQPSQVNLSELEKEVKQNEEQATKDVKNEAEDLTDARDEVDKALSTAEATIPPKPIEALNAQPLTGNLHPPETPNDIAAGTGLTQIMEPESNVVSPSEPQPFSPPQQNNDLYMPPVATPLPPPSSFSPIVPPVDTSPTPVVSVTPLQTNPLLPQSSPNPVMPQSPLQPPIAPQVADPNAPPPVPPPIPFPFGTPKSSA